MSNQSDSGKPKDVDPSRADRFTWREGDLRVHLTDEALAELEYKALHGEMPIGSLLRAYRGRAAITQAELARRIGVTQGHISQLEHAEHARIETINQYLAPLGKRIELSLRDA